MNGTERTRVRTPRALPPRARPRRVLLLFPGALGDFLLLAPAVAALRAAGTHVELSVRRPLVELARAIFPAALGPPVDGAVVATLFSPTLDPSMAAWLQGADRVDVWFDAPDLLERHAPALAITEVHRHRVERGDAGTHASLAYAATLGVAPAAAHRASGAVCVHREWLEAAAMPPRPRALVLHPGAGAPTKRWSTRGFARVADGWRARGGETVVLLGPAEEHDHAAWAANGHELATELGIREAAALLASAPFYVGNDSGISHLAGVLGRRGAVMFTATSAPRWRPLGDTLAAIACAGLTEDEASARALALLERPPAGRLDTPTPRH